MILESAGAAMVSAAGKSAAVDPGVYTGLMPTGLGKLTLLCIAVGAVAANALNIYSGAMSFLALGIRLPPRRARALVASIFGVCGFVLALFGLKNAGQNYENFLLIIAYWIGPWLGVVLVDRYLRRGHRRDRRGSRPAPLRQLGRTDRDGGRDGAVDLAVLQPDQVRRRRTQGPPGGRRHHLPGRASRWPRCSTPADRAKKLDAADAAA